MANLALGVRERRREVEVLNQGGLSGQHGAGVQKTMTSVKNHARVCPSVQNR
jgi:hypothetical protein